MKTDRPNVLIVDGSSGFGGATTTLVGLVEGLQQRGARVHIAASHDDGWDRLGLRSLVTPLVGEFQSASGAAYLWRELRRAAVLRSLMKDRDIDVVVANNDPAVNAAAHLAARATVTPLVQIIRGHARRSPWTAGLLEQANAVFSHGGAHEGRAAGFGQVVSRWHSLDEGLPSSQWPSPRRADASRWLWASTLARWKGLPLLLEAFGGLSGARPELDVCYIPLASGHSDAAAVPAACPAGVHLHEHPPDLDRLRAACSVYVHTALVAEPFGRSILEAMAAGLCPVVPDEGGGARLVSHLDTGIVYQARSAESLREAMALLVKRPALAAVCGARAALAARAFTSERVLRPLINSVFAATRQPGVVSRGQPASMASAGR
jgi:hypothetical protein